MAANHHCLHCRWTSPDRFRVKDLQAAERFFPEKMGVPRFFRSTTCKCTKRSSRRTW